MDRTCTSRTIGGTNRQRQAAGAAVLLVGAGACTVAALVAWPLYQTLLLLGAAVTLAWLVDGSSERYMGPGLLALAAGGGITIGNATGLEAQTYEHSIVYGLFGAAMLVIYYMNPRAVASGGVLLVLIASTVTFLTTVGLPFNPGWELAGLLAVWGVFQLVRVGRQGGEETASQRPEPEAEASSTNGARAREPVGAGGGRR
ncbi:MAG: hypothetical protein ACR2K0_02130 [Acidimicrobiales bacterium]